MTIPSASSSSAAKSWPLGWIAVPVVAGVLLLGVNQLSKAPYREDGAAAPTFSVKTFDGESLVLEELRGSVVMIDFWATWCPSCRQEMPMLISVANRYKSKRVRFVAMSQDDQNGQREALEEYFYHQADVKPFVALGNASIGERYRVDALPTMVIVDQSGRIRFREVGALDESSLTAALDRALAGQ
jgi:thiol-disulfide isomerase/thioredoxin